MDIVQINKKFHQLIEVHRSTIESRDKADATAEAFVHAMHLSYARDLTAVGDFGNVLDRQQRGLSELLSMALSSFVHNEHDVAALISMLDPASKHLGFESPEVSRLAVRIGELFDPKSQPQ